MKENFLKLSNQIIFGLIALAAAGAPLFFLPITSEFFEFNKFTLLLGITLIGLLVWATRMVLEKKAVFTRTPLDIPLLVLTLVFFIATLSSIDQFISFFGAHSRMWPSFLPVATAGAFYFLVVSNIKNRKQVETLSWIMVVGTVIASVIAIASYFNVYLPFDFAQNRGFNPTGAANRLGILQAMVIPITISWILYLKDKSLKGVSVVMTIILVFSFILINFWPAYAALAAALVFIAMVTLKTKIDKTAKSMLGILVIFTALFLMIRFVPQIAQGTLYAWISDKQPNLTESQQIDTPKELRLPQQAGWDIAAQTIGKRPLFGTGPGTYQFAFTQLKPRYLNSTDNWLIRFEKSSSEFSEYIATVGIVGILAYLLFAATIVRLLWAIMFKSPNSHQYVPLAAATVAFLTANFFTVAWLSTVIPFFLILGLLIVLVKSAGETHVYEIVLEVAALKDKFAWFPLGSNMGLIKSTTEPKAHKSQVLPILFAGVIVVVSFFAAKYQLSAYQGEYYFRQALLASLTNDGNKTLNYAQRAITANPAIDTYHRYVSQTALNAALNLSKQKDLNDEQKQLLTQLAQVAVDQAKIASGYQILPLRLPGISAANVTNWETLAAVYQSLIGSVGGSDVHATNALAQAVSLDPENPVLHSNLGLLYQRLNSLDLAQRKFEDATVVKPDYGAARYYLAKILIERKGEIPRIVNELTLAKRFLAQNDPAMEDINKNLDEYNKQLRELQEKAAQERKQATPNPNATPSPSTSPSPSPSPSSSPSPSVKPSPSPSL